MCKSKSTSRLLNPATPTLQSLRFVASAWITKAGLGWLLVFSLTTFASAQHSQPPAANLHSNPSPKRPETSTPETSTPEISAPEISAPETSAPEQAIDILNARCVACHGTDKAEGDLRLDSLENLLRGGERGKALVVGNAKASLLVESLRGTADQLRMPPKDPLTDREIETIEKWISAGAHWPQSTEPAMRSDSGNVSTIGNAWEDPINPIRRLFKGERLDLWSLRPIVRPPIPTVIGTDWPTNPIDCFVLAQWERENAFEIASPASPRSLAIRTALDLTGLPPTIEQIERFISDADPHKYQRWIERLLAEPSYGVRWARMWLDVVRYSDSNGFDWDEFRPNAWRYRDYVVDAWNRDLAFDEFTMQQLAGDELVAGAPNDFEEQQRLIATGYLRIGPHDNSSPLFNEQDRSRAQMLADLTETTGSAFLGLTLSCCRCHDHKTDPFSQADHFRFRAFFAPVEFADDLPLDLPKPRKEIEQHNVAIDSKIDEIDQQITSLIGHARERLNKTQPSPLGGKDGKELSEDDVKKAFESNEKKLVKELNDKKSGLAKQKRKFTLGLLMRDKASDLPTTFVLFQGDHKSPREPVNAGFPSVFDPADAVIQAPREDSTGRRTSLAKWITSEKNPWTARVIVNRLWQSHFGHGLVATPNDFGISGIRPSHPELLDWLASELINSGWSIKHIQHLIAMSSVYRQATINETNHANSTASTAKALRTSLRRLEAEPLRDRILHASGLIDLKIGGPPVWPEIPSEILQANPAFLDDNETRTKGWYPSPADQQSVRSLYLVQKRTVRIPFLETFDLPDNAVSCARREASLVAPQALTLLNGSQIVQAAHAMAKTIKQQVSDETNKQIELVFECSLLRRPTPEEILLAATFLKSHSLTELCRAMMNTNEFAFVD